MAKAAKKKEVSVNGSKVKKAPARKKATATLENKKEVEKEAKVTSPKPVEEPVKAEPAKAPAKPSKKSEPKAAKATKAKTTKTAKKTSKSEVKEEKVEKVEVKAEPKAEVKVEPKVEAKAEKVEVKAEPKVEAKAEKAEVKAEPKVEAKPAKKPAKKAPAKKTTKKAEAKKEEKPAKKTTKKTTAKKTTKKAEPKKDLQAEKIQQYYSFSVDTCIDMARAMGIEKGYDDYANLLMTEADEAKIAEQVIAEANIAKDAFTFEKDGYDLDLIPVLVKRIAETVDFKASDFANMKDTVAAAEKLEITEDAQANNEAYNTLMDVVRKVLMLAQRKNIHEVADMEAMLNVEVEPLVVKYMDVAYNVLKDWQYKDVKYYEGFIYSVLSQFETLHQNLGNKAMMDVADLYIIHGDYSLGDANYYYIIRENSLKDLIYYRFAHVYEDIDRDKARAIAGESRQYVDERFDYYEAIKNILEN